MTTIYKRLFSIFSILCICLVSLILGTSYKVKKLEVIVAYPSWKASIESIESIPYHKISGIIWAFALPSRNGDIELKNALLLKALSKQAQKNNVWVVLGVGGGNRSEPLLEIIKSPTKTAFFIEQLKTTCDQYHLQGVQIDFEAWPNKQNVDTVLSSQFLDFGKALRTGLPEGKYQIAYDVFGSDWYGKHFPSNLSAYADRISIMAMDATGSWSVASGNPSSLEFASSSITYWKKRIHIQDHEKLALVMPLYGKAFSMHHTKGMKVNSKSYKEIVNTYGLTLQDSIEINDSIIWYNSLNSIRAKKRLAEKEHLKGISFWEYFFDSDADSTSVLKNINP